MKNRLALASLIALSIGAAGCSPSDGISTSVKRPAARPGIRVTVAAATRADLSATVELVGSLLPRRRTVVVAEVDGVIESVPAPARNPVTVEFLGRSHTLPLDIGSEVAEGELLIKLDASDYERALQVAEAQLNKLKADLAELLAWQRPEEVARTRALHEEAKANVERADSEFQRVTSLRQASAVSESEYEEKETQLLRARALLAHAKANLDIAEAGPTEQEIAVAQAALAAAEAEVNHKRWKVEKASIVAPYNAVVTDRYVDVGDRVTALPRVEIMELMDVSFLVAEVGVPEKYGGSLHELDRATVRVQGVPDPIPGVVVRINDKVDPGSRTFRIRVAIQNDQQQLRVGQFARVYLDVATSPGTLTIPRQAVTYAGGQPQVFAYSGERVELKPVSLGLADSEVVEVLAGLAEGEQVVVDDPAVLTDGMQVELRAASVAQISRNAATP